MPKTYTGDYLGLGRARGLSLERLFVQLCAYTTPHGTESMLLPFFSSKVYTDTKGNLHVLIREKGGKEPIVQFCSHLDTACRDVQRVEMIRDGDIIKTDGTSVLGADCKIGVAIMLKMIEARTPGWYIFHVGEERGCIGANWINDCKEIWTGWNLVPKISIEFDRHSYGSIITHQRGERCCSEEFSKALGAAIGEFPQKYGKDRMFKSDDGGLYTDNACYIRRIPEVTNLSVGYRGHHTTAEQQDIVYAQELLERMLKIDWNALPIARDPLKKDSKWGNFRGWNDDADDGPTRYATKRYGGDDDKVTDVESANKRLRLYREQREKQEAEERKKLEHDIAVAKALVGLDKKDGKQTDVMAEIDKKIAEHKANLHPYAVIVDCPRCSKQAAFTPGELLSGKIFLCQDCNEDLSDEIDKETELLNEFNARHAQDSSGIITTPSRAKNLLK